VRIVQGRSADEALTDAVAAESAGAVIVGRIAKRGSHPLVRLGRVARRLVRHLPAPLVIAPPDLVEVGSGPVVALASLDRDSLQSCRFARDLSRLVSRPLAVLHVVSDPAQAAPYGLPGPAIDLYRGEALATARAGLAGWLVAAEVEAALTDVRIGDVVEQALAFSEEHQAALIVTGARRCHSVQRLYAPSVGRELAAAAPRPVAIVAPDGP
jgi:nucleotide-binding universal stress UspA family protein